MSWRPRRNARRDPESWEYDTPQLANGLYIAAAFQKPGHWNVVYAGGCVIGSVVGTVEEAQGKALGVLREWLLAELAGLPCPAARIATDLVTV